MCFEMKRPSRGERLGHGGAKTPVQIGGRWGELEVDSWPDLPGGGVMRVSSRKSSAALCIGREDPLQPRILVSEAEPIQPEKLRPSLQSPQAECLRAKSPLAVLAKKSALVQHRDVAAARMLAGNRPNAARGRNQSRTDFNPFGTE